MLHINICISDICNATITVGVERYFGKIEIHANETNPVFCQTFLAIRRSYTLRFRVRGLQRCSELPTGDPVFSISGETSKFQTIDYCHVHDPFVSEDFDEVYSQTLNLTTVYYSKYFLFFYIFFYTMHRGNCDNTEVSCNGCIKKDFACQAGATYCPAYQCADKRKQKNPSASGGVIAGVVCGCVFLLLSLFVGCWCHRNKLTCFQDRFYEHWKIAEQARAIFSLQLPRRGNGYRDGNENATHPETVERIAPSWDDTPPAYSSLENDNMAYTSNPEDGELPPSYEEATLNQIKYNVRDSVLHI